MKTVLPIKHLFPLIIKAVTERVIEETRSLIYCFVSKKIVTARQDSSEEGTRTQSLSTRRVADTLLSLELDQK